MPVLSATSSDYLSGLADQVANFSTSYTQQLADQVASYQNQTVNWANQVANFSNSYTENLANQVANYQFQTPQLTPTQVYQQSVSRTPYNYATLDEFTLRNIASQSTFPDEASQANAELLRRANQVATVSRTSPLLDPSLLNSILSQIPSLVTSQTNSAINPIINQVNSYLSQATASIQSAFNNLSTQMDSFDRNDDYGTLSAINILSNQVANFGNQSTEFYRSGLEGVTSLVNSYSSALSRQTEETSEFTRSVFDEQSDRISVLEQAFSGLQDDTSGSESTELATSIDNFSRDLGETKSDFFGFLDTKFDGLLGNLEGWIDFISRIVSDELKIVLDRIKVSFQKLKSNEYKNFDEFFTDLFGSGDPEKLGTIALSLLGIVPVFISLAQVSSEPIKRALIYLMNSTTPNVLLNIPDYVESFYRGDISRDSLDDYLNKLGVGVGSSQILVNNRKLLLNLDMLRTMLLRGIINEEEYPEELEKLGITGKYKNWVTQTFSILPPIQDIITMSVREVFSPQDRQDLGLDSNFPIEVEKWAEQQGLSSKWARNYWAAHWQLPSPQMGFEMFHRGIISYDRLKQLLKALDYTEVWRDDLIQLSYNPVTRVDIRRMYKQGNITYDEMVKRHKAIGLSPQDAKLLSDFVVSSITDDDDKYTSSVRTRVFNAVERAYENGEIDRQSAINAFMTLQLDNSTAETIVNLIDYERSILQKTEIKKETNKRTVNAILTAFRKGALPRSIAVQFLAAFNYTPEMAETELNFIELERQINLKKKAEDTAKKLYIAHTIDQTEMYIMLEKLQFTPQEKYFIWYEADLERKLKEKKLTEKQLEKLFADKIISLDEYAEELRGLGYTDKYVTWLINQDIIAFGV